MRPPAVRLVTMRRPARVLQHQAQGAATIGAAARAQSWRPATGVASAPPRAWRQPDASVTTDLGARLDRRPVLYTQPAPRSVAAPPTVGDGNQVAPTATPPPSPPPRPHPAPALQAQIDVPRLTEEVYRHLQRKIRIERERRGL